MPKLEIIAELHPQHGGDKGMIREMIRQARINGATAAKFQLYDAVVLLGSDQWNYLQFSEADTRQVKDWCDQEDIEFMASVFDYERLGWCKSLNVVRYKIASRTVTNDPDLCKAILAEGKETIVSLGNWTGTGKPFEVSDQIKYLYCKSKYPAMVEDMVDFPADFVEEGLAGYSDHTLGIEVALLAIARGADIIEKHFTLDKTRGKATEKGHIGSMTPDDLDTLQRIGGMMHRTRRNILAAAKAQGA
jgi:N,N'-diacetyllegionaminate synthase